MIAGNLVTFKPNTTKVEMPVKEYEILIDAQDALKNMIKGIADGKAVKESERLKLFQALVTFPHEIAINAPSRTRIEMTILAEHEHRAVSIVMKILQDEGHDDLSEIPIHINEIEGPFKSGFVISRYGG